MSLFGPSIKYSQDKHPISTIEIKKLVSPLHTRTLDQDEESSVEIALVSKKEAQDGKLSLQNIYEILLKMRGKEISKFDYTNLLQVFVDYYKKTFSV